MVLNVDIRRETDARGAICRRVLEALPGWFGIAEAREAYIAQARTAPMFAAWAAAEAVGYLAIATAARKTCEIHSMGVLPGFHRQGIGRLLVSAAEDWARGRGYRALTVKTLAEAHPDPGYAATRRFYRGVGFQPVRVDSELWGPGLPCLLMRKHLSASDGSQ